MPLVAETPLFAYLSIHIFIYLFSFVCECHQKLLDWWRTKMQKYACATKRVFCKKNKHCLLCSQIVLFHQYPYRPKCISTLHFLTRKHTFAFKWASHKNRFEPHILTSSSNCLVLVSFSKPQSKYLPKAKFRAALQAQHMAMPVSNPRERHLSGVPFRPMTAPCGRVLRVCEVLFEFSKWLQQEIPRGW